MAITRWSPTSTLVCWDPFREFSQMRETMNQAFGETPLGRREEGFLTPAWVPAVDVYETPETIVLKAELPGVNREDIDIQVEQNVLTLKGERKDDPQIKQENYYRVERQFGAFLRSFSLPRAVAADRIQATMRDGVLEIHLPKQTEAMPKRIKVG